MMDVSQGKQRARAWPRPRPGKGSEAQQENQAKFRAAQIATKYFDTRLYLDAVNAVAGTPLLPRDIMTMQLFNRLAMFYTDAGEEFWPMPAVLDVSSALDVLARQPGQMLARGDTLWGPWNGPDEAQMQAWLAALGGTNGQVLGMAGDLWTPITPFTPAGMIGSATVNPSQGTSSTGYTDLSTVGPAVTLETGTEVILWLSCSAAKATGTAGNTCYYSVAVSGASTIAASDNFATISSSAGGAGYNMALSRMLKLTGLTPGSNTFTAKYRVDGSTFNFFQRDLTVIAL